MSTIPSIDPTYITMMCDAFVSLEDVISDGELGALLIASGINDVHHNASRHRRLLAAIVADQDRTRCADNFTTFLRRTGFHIKKSRGEAALKKFVKEMNQVLSFAGYELNSDCDMRPLDKSRTSYVPPEADERSARFRELIRKQKMHPDIEIICRAENFVEPGYFKVVKEAMRMLNEKVKAKSSVGGDGPEMAERAFSFPWNGKPVLAINKFGSEKDLGEQFAFMILLKAFFLMFQDEQTRAYRTAWNIEEEEAIQLLSLASYLHSKVDASIRSSQ